MQRINEYENEIGNSPKPSIPDEAFHLRFDKHFDSKIHQTQQKYDFQNCIFKQFGTLKVKVLFSSCILFENRSFFRF